MTRILRVCFAATASRFSAADGVLNRDVGLSPSSAMKRTPPLGDRAIDAVYQPPEAELAK